MTTPLLMGSLGLSIGDYEVSLFLYLFILVLGLIGFVPQTLLRKWYSYRRRLKVNIITVEYEPPSRLSPAEVQYLFGGLQQERVVAATIIDLVQRGLLHIRKVGGKKLIYAGPKEASNLKLYERMLVVQAEKSGGIESSKLLQNPITYVDGSDVNRDSATLSEYVHDSLVEANLIHGKGVNQFFFDGLKVTLWLLFSLIWWPVMLFWLMDLLRASSSDFSTLLNFISFAGIATAVAFLPVLVFSVFFVKWRARLIGRRWMSTLKLTRLWPQLMGYRHYVKLTERGRLKFETDELKKSSSKDVLPYAVALGFVGKWRDIVN